MSFNSWCCVHWPSRFFSRGTLFQSVSLIRLCFLTNISCLASKCSEWLLHTSWFSLVFSPQIFEKHRVGAKLFLFVYFSIILLKKWEQIVPLWQTAGSTSLRRSKSELVLCADVQLVHHVSLASLTPEWFTAQAELEMFRYDDWNWSKKHQKPPRAVDPNHFTRLFESPAVWKEMWILTSRRVTQNV